MPRFPNRHRFTKRAQRIVGRLYERLSAIVLPHVRRSTKCGCEGHLVCGWHAEVGHGPARGFKAMSSSQWANVLSAINGAIDQGYAEAEQAGLQAAAEYGI